MHATLLAMQILLALTIIFFFSLWMEDFHTFFFSFLKKKKKKKRAHQRLTGSLLFEMREGGFFLKKKNVVDLNFRICIKFHTRNVITRCIMYLFSDIKYFIFRICLISGDLSSKYNTEQF